MDIAKKIEMVEQLVNTIADHDDEVFEVRAAALDAIEEMLKVKREYITDKHGKIVNAGVEKFASLEKAAG
jgi:hypothetical protein